MHALIVALSLLLAFVFAAGGAGLLLGAQPFAANMDRLGVGLTTRRGVALAELAAAGGLLIGLAWTPLSVAAAVGLVLLMVGAVSYHARAHDRAREYPPAVVLGTLASALLVLHAVA